MDVKGVIMVLKLALNNNVCTTYYFRYIYIRLMKDRFVYNSSLQLIYAINFHKNEESKDFLNKL